ncbi:RidA family protein [Enemella sp. A6]|uniref:RidA family protein n=1 Tax=Enemella sp. A6 TaxID=3440152 RepID=UPI003EB71EAC
MTTEPAAPEWPPLSTSLRRGNLVFVSGMVPIDPATGQVRGSTVEEQTEVVLGLLAAELQRQGATMADVVKTTVLLANAASDWAAMNEVYGRHFPDPKPTRSAYGVELAQPGLLVEIEAIAIVGGEE